MRHMIPIEKMPTELELKRARRKPWRWFLKGSFFSVLIYLSLHIFSGSTLLAETRDMWFPNVSVASFWWCLFGVLGVWFYVMLITEGIHRLEIMKTRRLFGEASVDRVRRIFADRYRDSETEINKMARDLAEVKRDALKYCLIGGGLSLGAILMYAAIESFGHLLTEYSFDVWLLFANGILALFAIGNTWVGLATLAKWPLLKMDLLARRRLHDEIISHRRALHDDDLSGGLTAHHGGARSDGKISVVR